MAEKSDKSAQKIPLVDLKAQYAAIGKEIREAIEEVLASQNFILGPEVKNLEEKISAYCGTKYGIGVSSGSDALLVALMALNINSGDEVITSAYSFFATAEAIARLGARPVFVDIDPHYLTLDPSGVAAAVTSRTRAIIPVHLFGRCAHMGAIRSLADEHDLRVIEDAAQAIGARSENKPAGSLGDAGCFSFFPTKILGGAGDGGMVITGDDGLAEKIRSLRIHGAARKNHHQQIGGNFRLDTLQAAVLNVKLRYLDSWITARRHKAACYATEFSSHGLGGSPVVPPDATDKNHIFTHYVIRAQRRDDLKAHLEKNGIGCGVYYPCPLHLQECFADLGYKPGNFPHAETAAEETLVLPLFPEMTESQVERVVSSIAAFYDEG